MIDIDTLKPIIIERLKSINLDKAILFGSYAYGTQTEDSDIDLYIVTNDEFIPRDFNEAMDIKLRVAYVIDPLRDIAPVDIIVHTKPMAEQFKKLNSSFCKEIYQRGEVLL